MVDLTAVAASGALFCFFFLIWDKDVPASSTAAAGDATGWGSAAAADAPLLGCSASATADTTSWSVTSGGAPWWWWRWCW
jgi:hypothetical protein